jgi:hypothetical protein
MKLWRGLRQQDPHQRFGPAGGVAQPDRNCTRATSATTASAPAAATGKRRKNRARRRCRGNGDPPDRRLRARGAPRRRRPQPGEERASHIARPRRSRRTTSERPSAADRPTRRSCIRGKQQRGAHCRYPCDSTRALVVRRSHCALAYGLPGGAERGPQALSHLPPAAVLDANPMALSPCPDSR